MSKKTIITLFLLMLSLLLIIPTMGLRPYNDKVTVATQLPTITSTRHFIEINDKVIFGPFDPVTSVNIDSNLDSDIKSKLMSLVENMDFDGVSDGEYCLEEFDTCGPVSSSFFITLQKGKLIFEMGGISFDAAIKNAYILFTESSKAIRDSDYSNLNINSFELILTGKGLRGFLVKESFSLVGKNQVFGLVDKANEKIPFNKFVSMLRIKLDTFLAPNSTKSTPTPKAEKTPTPKK